MSNYDPTDIRSQERAKADTDLRNKLAGNEKLEDALAEVLSNTEQRQRIEAEAAEGQDKE